jgi:hypothetical protein
MGITNQNKNGELNVLSESEEDYEFLTPQEKLWNAIESRQPITLIRELL